MKDRDIMPYAECAYCDKPLRKATYVKAQAFCNILCSGDYHKARQSATAQELKVKPKEQELSYSERLTIRRALEDYAARCNPATRSGLFNHAGETEKKEAERLQWLFKDAQKITVTE